MRADAVFMDMTKFTGARYNPTTQTVTVRTGSTWLGLQYYLDKLGRSLTAAVGAYNRAVGSLESRVLVSARRLGELEVAPGELPTPEAVTDAPRQLSSAELMDAVADPRADLPDLSGPGADPAPGARRSA